MSKRWFDYVHGWNGLCYYAGDEVFISLKTWAFGGKVKIIKEIEIGNKYRTEKSYPDVWDALVWNKVLILYLLLDFDQAESRFHKLHTNKYYEITKNRILHEMDFIVSERNYIQKHKIMDINHLIT